MFAIVKNFRPGTFFPSFLFRRFFIFHTLAAFRFQHCLTNRESGRDRAEPGRIGMWQKASRTERGLESYGVNLRLALRCHSPPHCEQGEERRRDVPEPPARTRPCNPRPWLRPRPITPPATPTTILLSPNFYFTALREHFSRGIKRISLSSPRKALLLYQWEKKRSSRDSRSITLRPIHHVVEENRLSPRKNFW